MSEAPQQPPSAAEAAPESAVPERIGRYHVVRRVGQGGFAEVFLAQDPATFAPLALKVLRKDIDPRVSEQVRARFLAEEKISKAIGHPAIVRIRETSAPGEPRCFIAMDFVEGVAFCDYFRALAARGARARQSEDYRAEVARLAHQVAEAMAVAHARGIVHRDLKPDNVLVCSSAEGAGHHVKILDFGIAKAPLRLFCLEHAGTFTGYFTGLGTVMGSPPFMAPEQNGAAHMVSGKADVFALGVMILVTVLDVDPDELALDAASLTLSDDCESRCREARLPDAWRELLVRMTADDPEQRPTMAEVALRLQRLLRREGRFGTAVEAWLREGRVPSARRLESLLEWAEKATDLTSDERAFVQRAPVQALARTRRRLSALAAAVVLTSCVGVLGAALAARHGALPRVPQTVARVPLVSTASPPAALREPAAPTAVDDAERLRKLESALAEREAELGRLTKLVEQRQGAIGGLQQQIAERRAAGAELERRADDLRAGLDAADSALVLCRKEADREAQSASTCRRELEAQSEHLAESAERLRLCSKSLRDRGTSGTASPDDTLTN